MHGNHDISYKIVMFVFERFAQDLGVSSEVARTKASPKYLALPPLTYQFLLLLVQISTLDAETALAEGAPLHGRGLELDAL